MLHCFTKVEKGSSQLYNQKELLTSEKLIIPLPLLVKLVIIFNA